MPRTIYCWRCRVEVPMLTEEEWALIGPHLIDAMEQIKRYREEQGCSLAEARAKGFGRKALAVYNELTGSSETNPDALFHHRLRLYGPPCESCGRPLRTPIARSCAACGIARSLAKYDPEQNRFEA
jgi:hypothetical protein